MNKFNLSTIQGKDIVIDVSKLLSDEILYIYATKLASQFNKDNAEWLKARTKSTSKRHKFTDVIKDKFLVNEQKEKSQKFLKAHIKSNESQRKY